MKIAVSQRVVIDHRTGERRDALDQRWPRFLRHVGLTPVAVPNVAELLPVFLDTMDVGGFLLTGGDDLASLGGDCPERDDTEVEMLGYASHHDLPLLGICRGMQLIQQSFGVRLQRVQGHITAKQSIEFEGRPVTVNSYHNFGSRETVPGLMICGVSADGVVKAVRSVQGRVLGIMWHPERFDSPRAEDVSLFRDLFGGEL